MDVQGFIDLFADDGLINAPKQSSAEQLSYVHGQARSRCSPGTHRLHVMGIGVAVELSIRGTFTAHFESPQASFRGPELGCG
jgi:hypothetical protein